MRIRRIKINKWRSLKDLSLSVPDSSAICLTGEHGAGKTTVLEFLGAVAQRAGLSNGFRSHRPDISDSTSPVDAEVEVDLSSEIAEIPENHIDKKGAEVCAGQFTLTLTGTNLHIRANGIETGKALFGQIRQHLESSQHIRFLWIDAERGSRRTIQPNEYGQAFNRNFDDFGLQRDIAFEASSRKLEDWFFSTFSKDQQFKEQLADRHRGVLDTEVVDPFSPYRLALKEVLPHLEFEGFRIDQGAPTFSSGSARVPFQFLSTGERDAAFVCGQLTRSVRKAPFVLIDEPEMHLHGDTLRRYLHWLISSVGKGQLWVASHALEAAETSGVANTFVFYRDDASPKVSSSEKSFLLQFGAALGTPAFALALKAIVYTEGTSVDLNIFEQILLSPAIRYLDGGGWREVESKATNLRHAVKFLNGPNVGAVFDRDFKPESEIQHLTGLGYHVLQCHEVENCFLKPSNLENVLKTIGRAERADDLLLQASDRSAGQWVRLHARVFDGRADKAARDRVDQLPWPFDSAAFIGTATTTSEQRTAIHRSVQAYSDLRDNSSLWRECLGKETMNALCGSWGVSRSAFIGMLTTLWSNQTTSIPEPVQSLMSYVRTLSA